MFDELLKTPSAQFGRIGRFAVFQVKLWIHCFRLLTRNRAGQQAAALSYYTVFGLVPAAVVMLMVFQFFPTYKDAGKNIKESVYGQLHLSTIEYPDPANPDNKIKLTDNIDAIIARIFTGINQGTIAIIGAALIIVAAIMLFLTIEGAFNNIWGISRGRGIVQRIVNYWALLTLGPLLIATAMYIATTYSRISDLQKTVISHTTPLVLSYIVAVLGFFVMYLVLPNTKVKARAAIWGAVLAALVWMIAKWGFKLYATKFIPYNEIYGVLGLIPLGVFWIYISWYIVLFGLQFTYTTQHLRTLDEAEIATTKKSENYFIASELTIMNIVGEIASAYEGVGGVVEPAAISEKLNIPPEFVDKILTFLVTTGVLVRVSEPKEGFMPAKDPGNMKLADIAEAVGKACFAHTPEEQPAGLQQVIRMQREALSHFTVKQLLESKAEKEA